MTLGGRATFSVPLIALVVAVSFGLFELATRPENSIFEGWSLFVLVFAYTAILSLPIGILLAVPAVYFGGKLPQPRLVYLLGIGVAMAGMLGFFLAGFDPDVRSVGGMALMGAISAVFWWLFVERHRHDQFANHEV